MKKQLISLMLAIAFIGCGVEKIFPMESSLRKKRVSYTKADKARAIEIYQEFSEEIKWNTRINSILLEKVKEILEEEISKKVSIPSMKRWFLGYKKTLKGHQTTERTSYTDEERIDTVILYERMFEVITGRSRFLEENIIKVCQKRSKSGKVYKFGVVRFWLQNYSKEQPDYVRKRGFHIGREVVKVQAILMWEQKHGKITINSSFSGEEKEILFKKLKSLFPDHIFNQRTVEIWLEKFRGNLDGYIKRERRELSEKMREDLIRICKEIFGGFLGKTVFHYEGLKEVRRLFNQKYPERKISFSTMEKFLLWKRVFLRYGDDFTRKRKSVVREKIVPIKRIVFDRVTDDEQLLLPDFDDETYW